MPPQPAARLPSCVRVWPVPLMAGRGPGPKEGRRRRNVPARGEWVELGPLEAPVLPELDPEVVWRRETVRAWELWRADPVTGQWTSADVALALDTIRLHNDWRASQMAELRQRMNELGLTPQGKRDLRFRVVAAVEVEGRPVVQARRLRAVG